MFGTSGIRGPVGETITTELAVDVGRALGSMSPSIVVGRDARESGDMLARAAMAGAQEAGADIVDIGVESTPTVARSVSWYDASAGLMVTASHNPPPDNGFKFWTETGQAFGDADTAILSERITDGAQLSVEWDRVGKRTAVQDASRRHLDRLPDGDLSPLTVVLDLGNGVGQLTADALLKRGCTVRTLDAQRDGRFPGRPSEPTTENCSLLSNVVATTDADLGLAHDGDADRLMAVDERGRFIPGDELLALFAADATASGGTVAVPINASAMVEAVVERQGGTVTRTAVGDVNIATACETPEVVFGGEPSGAWIWPAETMCPDGHYAATRLAAMVSKGPTLSNRTDSLPSYVTKRESLECQTADEVLESVSTRVRDRYDDVSELDGIRVDLPDGWFLIRASGTQPLIRVTAEAESESRAADILAEARGFATSGREADREPANT